VHVVNGDSTGDKPWAVRTALVAPAWQPRSHVLAYSGANGTIAIGNADLDHPDRSIELRRPPRQLAWTADGRRLVVVDDAAIRVYTPQARLLRVLPLGGGTVTVAPDSERLVVVRRVSSARSEVRLVDLARGGSRLLFSGAGSFGEAAWSPDGRWLLVAWPAADQWLFLRADGHGRVRPVANIDRSFGASPSIAGWCCP
jgi:Tol biopolymer transport system component